MVRWLATDDLVSVDAADGWAPVALGADARRRALTASPLFPFLFHILFLVLVPFLPRLDGGGAAGWRLARPCIGEAWLSDGETQPGRHAVRQPDGMHSGHVDVADQNDGLCCCSLVLSFFSSFSSFFYFCSFSSFSLASAPRYGGVAASAVVVQAGGHMAGGRRGRRLRPSRGGHMEGPPSTQPPCPAPPRPPRPSPPPALPTPPPPPHPTLLPPPPHPTPQLPLPPHPTSHPAAASVPRAAAASHPTPQPPPAVLAERERESEREGKERESMTGGPHNLLKKKMLTRMPRVRHVG